jgi:hypothetical protein
LKGLYAGVRKSLYQQQTKRIKEWSGHVLDDVKEQSGDYIKPVFILFQGQTQYLRDLVQIQAQDHGC